MNYLTLEHINKSYGEKTLFSDLSLKINQGDKVAIVARNGSGKSSLLRIVTGEDKPEGELADIYLNPDIRLAYLTQEPNFNKDQTIIEAILGTNHPWIQPLKSLHEAQLSNDHDAIEKALLQVEDQKAWETENYIKELLGKFKLPDLSLPVSQLSGGQKKRLSLVQVLSGQPDFLILDEPTNHLDLEMIEWLEKYLDQANLTLFMVTHDRYFLNRVCNQILELDRGELYKYAGDYEDFLEKKAARMQNENTFIEKTNKLLRKELEWVRRMPKARTTKNKARVDKFYDLKESVQIPKEPGQIEFDIETPRLGTKILELHHIRKSYESLQLIDNFSYKFKQRDRVGLIGPNGSGKTTLINLITEKIKVDQGKIILGDTVQFGHYTQDGIQSADDKRVIDVIRGIADYIPLKNGHKMSAEALLEKFLFPRSQQQVQVSQLSGGEKRRLYLLTILIQNPNFLILDEPTNDLDIITLNVLEEYLLDFPGCLLIVTHDRYFMDKIVNHVFVLEGDGKVADFPGNYTEYREALRNRSLQKEKEVGVEIKSKPDTTNRKINALEKKEMSKIEKDLESLHIERTQLVSLFSQKNMDKLEIATVNRRLSEIQQLIETKELRWMELAENAVV